MAAKRLTPEEAQFISSLRALMARGGSLPTVLADPTLQPIAEPTTRAIATTANVEPLTGYWNGTAATSFSRSFDGKYPTSAGSQLLIEANKLPGPPRGRGITLSRLDRPETGSSAGNENFAIYADIEFGIGANVQSVRVDWQNTIVNVPGSVIRVSPTWRAMTPILPYNVGDPAVIGGRLGVSVCTDPIVAKGFNTYTQMVDFGSPLNVKTFDIPPFAIGCWIPMDPSDVYISTNVFTIYSVPAFQISNAVSPVLGDIPSAQFQANGLTNLTYLPVGAFSIGASFCGVIGLNKVIWAIQI